ncbi:MAG TPA: isocitrate lyase/phosphoenolpyruvate mutase family protein [Micromonosporaceae bacterium]|jgi:2-methylisocitrate lyase-like PEP mutase family enzyme|nr:isocitrate lyase/phosphoenolpyruvate mutase family protein [Micromonosporaceae bacterium]
MRFEAFRALHSDGTPLLLPNAWDFASAAALSAAGFAAIGTTSLGVAASHGLPDAQGLARAETLALAERLTRLPCLLSVDIEAGFSEDPAEVAALVVRLAAAGAVGINLEDGRPQGTLAPIPRQLELIAAVKSAAPELFLNARTDTHWLAEGRPPALAETLARIEAYSAAGADGVFVPGLAGAADIRTVVEAVKVPVNLLAAPGRMTLREFADLGVRRVSCGSLLFRAALHTTVQTALAVSRDQPVMDGIPGYAEVERLADL